MQRTDKAEDQRIDTGLLRILTAAVNGAQADKAAVRRHVDGIHAELLNRKVQSGQCAGRGGDHQAQELDAVGLDADGFRSVDAFASHADINAKLGLIHHDSQHNDHKEGQVGNRRVVVKNIAQDRNATKNRHVDHHIRRVNDAAGNQIAARPVECL